MNGAKSFTLEVFTFTPPVVGFYQLATFV